MARTSSGTRKAPILRVRIMPARTRSNQRGSYVPTPSSPAEIWMRMHSSLPMSRDKSLTFVPVAEVLPKRLRDRTR